MSVIARHTHSIAYKKALFTLKTDSRSVLIRTVHAFRNNDIALVTKGLIVIEPEIRFALALSVLVGLDDEFAFLAADIALSRCWIIAYLAADDFGAWLFPVDVGSVAYYQKD